MAPPHAKARGGITALPPASLSVRTSARRGLLKDPLPPLAPAGARSLSARLGALAGRLLSSSQLHGRLT